MKAILRTEKLYERIAEALENAGGGGGGSLTDLDTLDFGDDPTLPEEGKTDPQNYEDIADAINTALARPNAVTIEPLSVTANDTYTESGKAYSPVTVNVPNPNSVETITGTFADILDGLNAAQIVQDIESNNATYKIDFENYFNDSEAETLYLCADSVSGVLYGMSVGYSKMVASWSQCVNSIIGFVWSVVLQTATLTHLIWQADDDTTDAGDIPCTLTIIHHPLPTV